MELVAVPLDEAVEDAVVSVDVGARRGKRVRGQLLLVEREHREERQRPGSRVGAPLRGDVLQHRRQRLGPERRDRRQLRDSLPGDRHISGRGRLVELPGGDGLGETLLDQVDRAGLLRRRGNAGVGDRDSERRDDDCATGGAQGRTRVAATPPACFPRLSASSQSSRGPLPDRGGLLRS